MGPTEGLELSQAAAIAGVGVAQGMVGAVIANWVTMAISAALFAAVIAAALLPGFARRASAALDALAHAREEWDAHFADSMKAIRLHEKRREKRGSLVSIREEAA